MDTIGKVSIFPCFVVVVFLVLKLHGHGFNMSILRVLKLHGHYRPIGKVSTFPSSEC